MSLVNQMLKDLEQRRAELPAADSLAGLHAAPAPASAKRSWWLGATVFTVMSGAAAGWLVVNGTQADSVAAVAQHAPALPAGEIAVVEISRDTPREPRKESPAIAPSEDIPLPPVADAQPPEGTARQERRDAAPDPVARRSGTSGPVGDAVATPPAMRKVTRAPTAAEQAEQHYARALRALDSNDSRGAEQALREALALNSGHAQVAEHYAALLVSQSRTAEAQTTLRSALAVTGGHPRLSKLLARLLADEQRNAEALALLQEALGASQNDSEYFALVGALSQRLEDHRAAVEAYRRAVALDPRRGAWWMGLGISLERLQRSQDAMTAYHAAIKDTTLSAAVITYLQSRIDVLNKG